MAHQGSIHTELWVETPAQNGLFQDVSQPYDRLSLPSSAMSLLCTFAEAMNNALDLNEVLQVALRITMEVARMNAGGALLLDPHSRNLLLKAHIGGAPALVRTGGSVQVDEGLMPRMLDSVFAANEWTGMTEKRRLALEESGARTLLSIPLMGDCRVQGVIILVSQQWRRFDDQERDFYAIIGRHVGTALHRINLQTQELRVAVLEERQAMARQMHDDIAQTLACLGLSVDEIMDHPNVVENVRVASELEEVRRTIERAYQRVRTSIARLGQDIPAQFDLRAALQEIVDEFRRTTKYQVGLDIDVDWLAPLSPLVAIQASYIIQEALNNTRKHAQPCTVKLSLCRLEDGTIELVIQDDGRGFDVASPPEPSEDGFGLRFMAQRAQRIGGTCYVTSEPGRGTQVIVRLPG